MDTVSTDIVTLIFEMACRDDFGQTARNLGLVSKDFRAIAEPIELRSTAVSGIEQLRGAVARLEKVTSRVGPAKLGVRHLFISEIKVERVLTGYSIFCGPPARVFGKPLKGQKLRRFILTNSARTSSGGWLLASSRTPARNSGHSILFPLTSGFPFRITTFVERILSFSWKIQGTISGVAFPNLASLMVDHGSIFENIYSTHNGQLFNFKTPHTPSLRKLCIRSPIFLDLFEPHGVHPFLELVHSETSKITHLTICDGSMDEADKALRAIFGEDMENLRKTRASPKELQSVVLQEGIPPIFGRGNSPREFAKSMQEIEIDGLKTEPNTTRYTKGGDREFELLLADWKEDILAFSS